jgi:hypothetical protein
VAMLGCSGEWGIHSRARGDVGGVGWGLGPSLSQGCTKAWGSMSVQSWVSVPLGKKLPDLMSPPSPSTHLTQPPSSPIP